MIRDCNKAEDCNLCGSVYSLGGKLWISNLFDKNFIQKMINFNFKGNSSKNFEHINRLFCTCLNENDDIPFYFLVDEIASKLKTSPLPVQKIIERLSALGYKSSKVSLNARAFKTDAKINEILDLLR
jgi:tRNA G26 N,N-dimethylase Trm1